MTYLQAIIFAFVQGVTELFPISSIAHTVLVPYILRWNLSFEFLKENFLPFIVMLHLGTTIALLTFFGRDWIQILKSVFYKNQSKKLLYLIIVGTIPAIIIGFLFEKLIRTSMSNVTSASIFLILNGFMLYLGEKLHSKGKKRIEELSYKEASIVGLVQCLAFIPGFSRSGSSMTAGFWVGLSHEESVHFSMLLATPVIAGAAVIEIPKLIKTHINGLFQISILGGIVSAVFAFIAILILVYWFKKKEINAMLPFSYYCWIVGTAVLISKFF
ncbi:undecaprenyl-diphosphate phosphatase [Aceticella autotrophica]|uniref:Undecaprenyl-diphosphatase n=1 Tax=Aceticella autotrophica TaxID=2755338 RepID=A0A975AUR3_9THEO|nr:undecaprenyl-diphosphate phosphatase [Aceticella autotrophica]QSZ26808.1 undecaprenyl-diphosphate phosphatase [Aceticella autotrophica]